MTGANHAIQAYTWTKVANTSFECRDCGEIATTPRGFSQGCESETAAHDEE